MKAILGNFVSLLEEKKEGKTYEWKEILVKLGILGISMYFIVVADIIVYGYLAN